MYIQQLPGHPRRSVKRYRSSASAHRTLVRGLALALALALAGCSSIPRSGPVGTIAAQEDESAVEAPVFSPQGPRAGAAPEELLPAFITAGTGAADGYEAAREFLTEDLAAAWQPEDRIIIFRTDPRIVETSTDGVFQIQLEVVGSINAQGIRSTPPVPATETIRAEMVQENGQWRISAIPDGIMVTETNISELARPHNLYFYASNYRYWVPDSRWFVRRPGVTARIVQSMLAGPAPYLKGAVTSAFPEGVTLGRESVPITSGIASVELSSEALQDATSLRLQQMQQQLEVNLTSLNNVTAVEMTAGQRIELGEPDPDLLIPVADPPAGPAQVVLVDNEIQLFEEPGLSAVDGLPSVAAFDPHEPAMSPGGSSFAFLNGQQSELFATAPGSEVRSVISGAELTAPSFDQNNWAWTWSSSWAGSGPQVLAIPPGGVQANAVTVAAPWLAGRRVIELRISRDGARALLVVTDGTKTQVLVAGITRSGEDIPQTLVSPLVLDGGTGIAAAVWAGEDSVLVSGISAKEILTPTLLGLDGAKEPLAARRGILNISAGSDPAEDLFIQTSEGLLRRVGSSWIEVLGSEKVRDPAYPG